jgi:hypothetical protein
MKFKQISLVIAATALLGACGGMQESGNRRVEVTVRY